MTAYIGTATSRIDGRAKVTGEAKYAAEFNPSDLAYGSIIESTITKGRIVRIDTAEARRVEGVPGRTMSRRKKARRSVRCTTITSNSAGSPLHWCWPRNGRSHATRPR